MKIENRELNWPRISIVTPSFNQAGYIEDTIVSVLSQGYPNLEYIIVDGGSTDGSQEIIKKYEERLTFWLSEPDNGMYDALQKGFNRCTGEVMAWINSDDMYHSRSLFTVGEIFAAFAEVNWLAGASTAYDEYGRTVEVAATRRFSKYDFIRGDYKWLQQESVFWRRSLWEKAGSSFNSNIKYAGDFALWMKFFSFEKLYTTNALIGGFRWRTSGQITVELLNSYTGEIEDLRRSEKPDEKESRILARYKRVLKTEEILKKMKIFKTGALKNRFRRKYFSAGKRVVYDRTCSAFLLKD